MDPINEGKKKAKNKIRESYEKHSIIPEVVQVKDFNPEKNGGKKFLKIPIKTDFPKDWFTRKDIYPYFAFESIGRSLAISEEKSLVNSLFEREDEVIETEVDSFDDTLRKELTKLEKDKKGEIALFCPIDYYTELLDKYTGHKLPKIEWKEHQPFLKLDDKRIFRIFWSSKHIDFDNFLLVDGNDINWIVKKDKSSNSRIRIEMNDKNSEIELIVKTIFRLELPDRDFLAKIKI